MGAIIFARATIIKVSFSKDIPMDSGSIITLAAAFTKENGSMAEKKDMES